MIKSHLCDQEMIVHWVKQSLWPRKTSNSNWLTTGYIGGSLQWMNNPLFRGAVHSASANVSQDYKTWFRQTGSLQCTQWWLLTMNMIFVQYQPHLLDTDRSTVLIRTQAPGLAKDLLTFGKYICCCNWTLMADMEAWAPSHSKHLIVFWKYQARQTQYISTSCSVVHLLTLFIWTDKKSLEYAFCDKWQLLCAEKSICQLGWQIYMVASHCFPLTVAMFKLPL